MSLLVFINISSEHKVRRGKKKGTKTCDGEGPAGGNSVYPIQLIALEKMTICGSRLGKKPCRGGENKSLFYHPYFGYTSGHCYDSGLDKQEVSWIMNLTPSSHGGLGHFAHSHS